MSKMTYNFLGNSGLKVSNICLGTMTFGVKPNSPKQTTEEESHAILDEFIAQGGNFIDTANVYGHGDSEKIIGNWLAKKQNRSQLIIGTKVRGQMNPDDVNCFGLSRKHIMDAVEGSLKRLQTDYIDLYQTHGWDNATPIEETFSTLNDLVRMGKVRYIGVSNVSGWQLQKIIDLCKFKNWAPIVSLQQQLNLLCRETEFELIDVCKNEGIGFLPWSPLKGGWLTGKVTKDKEFEAGSRIEWSSKNAPTQSHPSFEQFDNPRVWKLMDCLNSIAKLNNKTVAQVSLKWLLQKQVVTSVIIGAKNIKQLDDNITAGHDWSLSNKEIMQLNELSQPIIPYPYEMILRMNANRK